MDRNPQYAPDVLGELTVAPLTGSVDRNPDIWRHSRTASLVAPHTGSVDRTSVRQAVLIRLRWMSLPSRGAWIEMVYAILNDAAMVNGRSPHGERG